MTGCMSREKKPNPKQLAITDAAADCSASELIEVNIISIVMS